MATWRQARGGTLILGGGFAESYVARLLGKAGATIVSPENFVLYTPILPEAGSGTIEPRHAVVPVRQMARTRTCCSAGRHRAPEPVLRELDAADAEQDEDEAADPQPYGYRMLGQVATLGRYKGIADILGLRVRGFPGWFVTRTYHLYQRCR